MMRKIAIILTLCTLLTTLSFADGANDAIDNWAGTDQQITYTDLDSAKWAEEAIYYLSDYGVIEHTNGAVNPNRYIKRAEFIKLIIASFGMYSSDAECSFTDVPKNSPYYPYVASAYQLGIVKGVSSFLFGTDENLSRQDMAVIIYRLAKECGVPFEDGTILSFKDTQDIDSYATDAVSALVTAGAVNGTPDNMFLPKNYSTFAESCKIVYYLMLKNT